MIGERTCEPFVEFLSAIHRNTHLTSMKIAHQALSLSIIALSFTAAAQAPDMASPEDKAFVAKVSQGGRYEVEASALALHKAIAMDVKDIAAAEVHDHALVNGELKMISSNLNVPVSATLNPEFQAKLTHLRNLSGEAFDEAYMEEMRAIHDKDEKLFAQEAREGGSAQYRKFAIQTDRIVKRHIGALHGIDGN
jgi:putative membrane protein